jgi:thymidylate synthase (FAD)
MMFDFNKVRAVGITVPLLDEIPDSEGLISYSARVSNPSNQNNFETADKLLAYCAKHKHYSVFEMCNVILEIETPRDIARQILRHRSFSFQEFSQRYAEATTLVTREARMQDTKNRQNSVESDDEQFNQWWNYEQGKIQEQVTKVYQEALDKGVAKEVARVILPEGMTMSRMYMNGTVRSWMHYTQLRKGNGTQKEHQDVAEKCAIVLSEHLPSLADHF